MSPLSLKTLSALRMVVGTSCLLVPRQAGPLFGVVVSPESMILGRMTGIRDLVLGAYLWKRVRDWEEAKIRPEIGIIGHRQPLIPKIFSPEDGINAPEVRQGEHESRRLTGARQNTSVSTSNVASALWLGLITDGVDVASCIVCSIEGNLSTLAQVSLGGGAVLFTAIAAQHMLIMRRERTEEGER